MLKHWAQSWLLGVPTIEVGFRDEAGILQSRTTFETGRIPRLSVQAIEVLSSHSLTEPASLRCPTRFGILTRHYTSSIPSSRLSFITSCQQIRLLDNRCRTMLLFLPPWYGDSVSSRAEAASSFALDR